MDTGREVHQYLEAELGEYVYRGDDVRIRLSEDAAQVVATDAEGDVDGRIAVENAGETP